MNERLMELYVRADGREPIVWVVVRLRAERFGPSTAVRADRIAYGCRATAIVSNGVRTYRITPSRVRLLHPDI